MSRAYADAMGEREVLTAEDRCDRCPARAVHRVETPGRGTLDFCAHHWNEHKDALQRLEATVVV